jgi:hypothetical protein
MTKANAERTIARVKQNRFVQKRFGRPAATGPARFTGGRMRESNTNAAFTMGIVTCPLVFFYGMEIT